MDGSTGLHSAFSRLGLSWDTAEDLGGLAGRPRTLERGEALVRQGDRSTGLSVLLDGLLKSFRTLHTGSSQTLGLYARGDICGADSFGLGFEPTAVTALTRCVVVTIPQSCAELAIREHPEIATALWRAAAREVRILQEWVVGMGLRQAQSQIAHLLCEIATRTALSGPGKDAMGDFPLTQSELADVVGLSNVHVNRVLQQLRAAGLIQLGRQLRILDWEGLADLADFDPAYLHLPPTGRVGADVPLRPASGEPIRI